MRWGGPRLEPSICEWRGAYRAHEEGPQGASGSASSRLPSRGSLVPERVAQHAGGENPGKNERLRIAG